MSNEEDHLMDREKFNEFTEAMWNELVKHKDNKISLKDMLPENVYSICLIQIKRRLAIIKKFKPEDIIKQDIHCANYLFFMWVKMKELLDKNA